MRAVTAPGGTELAPGDIDWTGLPGGEPERRAGRPATGRAAQTVVRSTPEEREAWERAAEAAGTTIGLWARDALDAAARR